MAFFAAYYIARLPRMVKGVLDVLLTLPMVLPPTVVGYFLLLLFGAKRPLGIFFMQHFGVKLVMNWYSAIFASIVVAFPLMYRTARGAFESFDETLAWSAQTLGQSDTWIFWRVRMPACRQGILAGTVLAFAPGTGRIRRYQHDRGLQPPARPPPLPPRCTSSGAPTMNWVPCGGCWWISPFRLWCCWR